MRADRAIQVHREALANVEEVKAIYSGNCVSIAFFLDRIGTFP
jgi:hypothetical protein